jgi:hypothetical protein
LNIVSKGILAPPDKIVQMARLVPEAWGPFIELPTKEQVEAGLSQYGTDLLEVEFAEYKRQLVERIAARLLAKPVNTRLGWRLAELYDVTRDDVFVRLDVWVADK